MRSLFSIMVVPKPESSPGYSCGEEAGEIVSGGIAMTNPPGSLKKVLRKSPTLGAKPPAGDKPLAAYVTSLSVENIRCFGKKETLAANFKNGDKWEVDEKNGWATVKAVDADGEPVGGLVTAGQTVHEYGYGDEWPATHKPPAADTAKEWQWRVCVLRLIKFLRAKPPRRSFKLPPKRLFNCF